MALKPLHLNSLALDICMGVKATNNVLSFKNTEILPLGSNFQGRNSWSLRTANPPAATFKSQSVSEGSPEEPESSGSSVQSQLDLLEQLTSNSSGNPEGNERPRDSSRKTIREQLGGLVVDEENEVAIPLGKRFKATTYNSLTISQKRNIKRQEYLNKVAKRNDIPFFTTIALFVILPPVVILGVAVATGYVDLFP